MRVKRISLYVIATSWSQLVSVGSRKPKVIENKTLDTVYFCMKRARVRVCVCVCVVEELLNTLHAGKDWAEVGYGRCQDI